MMGRKVGSSDGEGEKKSTWAVSDLTRCLVFVLACLKGDIYHEAGCLGLMLDAAHYWWILPSMKKTVLFG